MAKCAGITRSGRACKGIPIEDSQWCYAHHPDHAGERRRHGAKGGKRGGRGRPQAELREIKMRLSDLADDVLAGKVNRANAAVAGQFLNTIIRAVGMELKAREQEDLIERLEELESLLPDTDNGRGRYGA